MGDYTACSLRGSVGRTGWALDCFAGACTWYQNPPEVERICCQGRVELVNIQTVHEIKYPVAIFLLSITFNFVYL